MAAARKRTTKGTGDAENIARFSTTAQNSLSAFHSSDKGYTDNQTRLRERRGFTAGDGHAIRDRQIGQTRVKFFYKLHIALRVYQQGNERMLRDASHGCNIGKSTCQRFATHKSGRSVGRKMDSLYHNVRFKEGIPLSISACHCAVIPRTEDETCLCDFRQEGK